MNISAATIQRLKSEFEIRFYDNQVNDVDPSKATVLSIQWTAGFQEYVGKQLRVPAKKEVTFEWVMEKLGAEKVYTSFAPLFNKMLKRRGVNGIGIYATTYGIGVEVAISWKGSAKRAMETVESQLNELGVLYTTEYSEAGWVFRFKISKQRSNLDRLEQIVNDMLTA